MQGRRRCACAETAGFLSLPKQVESCWLQYSYPWTACGENGSYAAKADMDADWQNRADLYTERSEYCVHHLDITMATIYRITSIDQRCTQQLCVLLQDAVEGGASVGFLSPLSTDKAMKYWRQVSESLFGNLILWVAETDGQIVGAIQLELSGKENGMHRAEIQKLFVLQKHRGNGLSSKLMSAAEQFAITQGRSLLVLDTQAGSKAESIYQHLGWTHVGQIPDYAASPSGDLQATAYYFKRLKG